MLKAKEEIQLEVRLKEVHTSIKALESAHPNHPALYHLKSEKKWMEQRLKKSLWYNLVWRLTKYRGVFLMSTLGIRIWFVTRIKNNPFYRILIIIFGSFVLLVMIIYQLRKLFGLDFFPNSDSPIDEWILGIFGL
ncbi:hypothetical protein N9N66_01300 [Schleiferiaceae bacterium]|nr:hypothetical protein [Schleiferiaceae bacterium]